MKRSKTIVALPGLLRVSINLPQDGGQFFKGKNKE
jgi:hypothetical protein